MIDCIIVLGSRLHYAGDVWKSVPKEILRRGKRLRMQADRLQQALHGRTHAVIIIDNEHDGSIGASHAETVVPMGRAK
jgi:hypothetical protein